MIDCEFLYFDGDKTSKKVTGTKTKPDERIALEYFEETIDKWVCTSIVPENTRYRIRREMGSVAVRYPDKGIDWEQRRYEIARDIYVQYRDQTPEAALMSADKLIKKLRKQNENEVYYTMHVFNWLRDMFAERRFRYRA